MTVTHSVGGDSLLDTFTQRPLNLTMVNFIGLKLVAEELIMTISNEIYQFVGTIKTETITYEIDTHVKRWHHLQHVLREVWGDHLFELAHVALHGIGARVGVGLHSVDFFDPSTIHDFGPCAETLCHFTDWEAADRFVLLSGEVLTDSIT